MSCPHCDKRVAVDTACQLTYCPWELRMGDGRVFVARLRRRIK